MNYNYYSKNGDIFIKYSPKKKKIISKLKTNVKDNPFNILSQLNIK